MPSTKWQEKVAAKQRDLWRHAGREWKVDGAALEELGQGPVHDFVNSHLSTTEQQITEHSTPSLLEALASGDISAAEVVQSYGHRAILAHQTTNCLCEINFSSARARAQELDAHLRSRRSRAGPLHGLPVSFMDRFHINDMDSCCGFVSWIGRRQTNTDEGTMVRILRQLGALLFCKTNVPMSIMLGETTNNIIGTTTNPHNTALSAGGACGGEGALLALGGSKLGIGTDVAGSSRIPAAFCGLWALKCSELRLPHDGVASVLSGIPVAYGAIGLMSNELATLEVAFKAILSSNIAESDPNVVEIPWRQERVEAIRRRKGTPGLNNGRLVFGILACDGQVRPHPPIQRAINLVSDALREAGHELVEWTPPTHAEAVETLFKILGSTSAREARAAIIASGEPPIQQIRDWFHGEDVEPNSTAEFWELCAQRSRFCKAYKAYWNSVGDQTASGRSPDCVITPVAPTLACRPNEFLYYGYSAVANTLDYTAGVFPVTVGDRALDAALDLHQPLSDLDQKIQETYRPAEIHNMPVALQIMCPRLEEERVLALMEEVAQCLGQVQR